MGGEDDQEFAAVRGFETVSAGPVGDQAVAQAPSRWRRKSAKVASRREKP